MDATLMPRSQYGCGAQIALGIGLVGVVLGGILLVGSLFERHGKDSAIAGTLYLLLGAVFIVGARSSRTFEDPEEPVSAETKNSRSVQVPTPPPPRPEKIVERHVERYKVIERQIVVVRCKFCRTLTPVDLEKCENCGAKKFDA